MLSPENINFKIFDRAIACNVRFAVFRVPNSKNLCLIIQKNNNSINIEHINHLSNQQGFVIAPFCQNKNTPLIIIQNDIYAEDIKNIYQVLNQFLTSNSCTNTNTKNSTRQIISRNKYNINFDLYKQLLSENKIDKIVLSRNFEIKTKDTLSPCNIFKKALNKYPSNFIYLCHTPDTGTWIGASPELLLNKNNNKFETVALAGTRKCSDEEWDEKNQYEQQIVSDYIENTLSKIDVDTIRSKPYTIKSGTLEHIKTDFNFRLAEDSVPIGKILDILHPTPAVCGFPKTDTFNLIINNEGYNRRYYSGFIGPLNIKKNSHIYVNLRCLELIDNHTVYLYAGGGIMPNSNKDKEWEETTNKMATMATLL